MTPLHTAEGVAAEVKRRLQLCTVAQGAETDFGLSVLHGQAAVEADMAPCCKLVEGDDVPARGNARTDYEIEQRFAAIAYLPCNPADPMAAAHAGVRDIKRALFRTDGKADHRWGGSIKSIEYLGKQMGFRQAGERMVLAIVEFSITYAENVAAP